MTEEDFLKRWSRRKREVAEAEKPAAAAGDSNAALETDAPSAQPQAEFDPATLPPIESITAVSDITSFLRADVPVELTRAALRRVWTADPAIRDFVGLAENAWDFTDPNAMPGFGPLEFTDEVRRMIAQIVDSIGEAAKPTAGEAAPDAAEVSENSSNPSVIDAAELPSEPFGQMDSVSDQAKKFPAQMVSNQVLLHSNKEDIAAQRDATEAVEKPKQNTNRGHGRALPK